MKRFDPNWLLSPILGVLGTVGMTGAQACGGKVETQNGASPVEAQSQAGAASSETGAGGSAMASSNESGGSGGATGNGAGGSGGSEIPSPVGVWQWQTGDMPSGRPVPEPTTLAA